MLVPVVPLYRYSPHPMPTPTTADASAAAGRATDAGAGESPKRKYSQAMTIRERVPALIVNPAKLESEDHSPSGTCNSPRSRVAEKLEALDIDQDAPRKRAKMTAVERDEHVFGPELTPVHPNRLPFNLNHANKTPTFEIAETPGCRPPAARSPTASPIARHPTVCLPPTTTSAKPKTSPKRMRSPPPPSPSTSQHSPSHASPTSSTTSPSSSQNSPAPATMTWQDSEITGHEIHASLGDDGEGINGIGFRPTPAMAQARSQKRKQQVNAWRAREAREARQRRFEKRQGCSLDVSGGDESQRRVVRFEGVG
ncbi:hypothetical protein Q7P37_008532 [Cladosporium fusiforme]